MSEHAVTPVRLVEDAPAIRIEPTNIRFREVPKIPKDSALLEHQSESLPEFWDGDLSKFRVIPIQRGGIGHAGTAFASLRGEPNIAANAFEYLLSAQLPERWQGKLLLLAGSRFIGRPKDREFVLAISTFDGKQKPARLCETDAVQDQTYAIVLRD